MGDVRPRRVFQRSAGRVRDGQAALPARRAARHGGPDRDRQARSEHRRAPWPQVPGGWRASFTAAPLQPDVQDVHGARRGRRRNRVPAPRDGAGFVRQLQERAAVDAQEAALWHCPDRQELPQRDLPRQLRLPDARVRADGDAVLRAARRRGAHLRGVAAASLGVVHGLRRDRVSVCASANTPRTSSRTMPRRRSTSSTASRSAGRSSRASTTAATST